MLTRDRNDGASHPLGLVRLLNLGCAVAEVHMISATSANRGALLDPFADQVRLMSDLQ